MENNNTSKLIRITPEKIYRGIPHSQPQYWTFGKKNAENSNNFNPINDNGLKALKSNEILSNSLPCWGKKFYEKSTSNNDQLLQGKEPIAEESPASLNEKGNNTNDSFKFYSSSQNFVHPNKFIIGRVPPNENPFFNSNLLLNKIGLPSIQKGDFFKIPSVNANFFSQSSQDFNNSLDSLPDSERIVLAKTLKKDAEKYENYPIYRKLISIIINLSVCPICFSKLYTPKVVRRHLKTKHIKDAHIVLDI